MVPSIPFHAPLPSSNHNNSSLSLLQTTSLEVCNFVYGDSHLSSDSLTRYYEPNAGEYENPLITATTRSVITDIFQLSQHLRQIDVKTPAQTLAMFLTLFRLHTPRFLRKQAQRDPLFTAIQVWTELDDVCESESFDGHRKCIVEHTLNVLLLPSLHVDVGRSYASSDSILPNTDQFHPSSVPALPIPGTGATMPSPLHLRLRVVTRLLFNEQGSITRHRDFWDVKDLLGLVPGVSLAQWIGTRLAGTGLSYLLRCWQTASQQQEEDASRSQSSPSDYASPADTDPEPV